MDTVCVLSLSLTLYLLLNLLLHWLHVLYVTVLRLLLLLPPASLDLCRRFQELREGQPCLLLARHRLVRVLLLI
jgi:hypothetical protein